LQLIALFFPFFVSLFHEMAGLMLHITSVIIIIININGKPALFEL
jgi:hypothetical protein